MASQSSSSCSDVEILVHVAAPGRVADDARYRRLAEAYLSFAPGARALVTSPVPQRPPPSRQCDYDEGLLRSFCSDSQDLSLQGALDNMHSPRVVVAGMATPPRALPDETVALPSQIADSYPMPDCDLFNVTPTRVLQRYMGGSRQPAAPTPTAPRTTSSPTLSSDGDDDDTAKGVKTEVQAVDDGISSSLPLPDPGDPQESRGRRQATIPVTPLISQASRKRKALACEQVHDASPLDVTHISSSIPASSSSSSVAALPRAESDPLPSKRLRQEDPSAVSLARHTSDTTTTHQPRPPSPSSSPLSYSALSQIPSTQPPSSSLSARPPSPPISVAHLDLADLVSSKLAKLARDLSSRYRPTHHRRSGIAPLERGHWRVDCRRWPPALRADAWAFLAGYVRSGLAGWGVWCHRDPAGEVLKLYGWAHVAKHTYLLLYLASGRQIKKTGAQWIDADGVVAVEVLP